MKKNSLIAAFLLLAGSLSAQSLSDVWVPDLGNGKYKNPIIDADYSDPDVCRVGDDYYMTSSSFNCIPALPNSSLERSCQLDNHRLCSRTLETRRRLF